MLSFLARIIYLDIKEKMENSGGSHTASRRKDRDGAAVAAMGPELYATAWLMTALARTGSGMATPLELVFRLWDVVIAVDDAAVVPLLALELLRSRRFDLLIADRVELPEILSTVRLIGAATDVPEFEPSQKKEACREKEDMSQVKALQVAVLRSYEATPEALLEPLRSVCTNVARDQFHSDGDGNDGTEGEDDLDHRSDDTMVGAKVGSRALEGMLEDATFLASAALDAADSVAEAVESAVAAGGSVSALLAVPSHSTRPTGSSAISAPDRAQCARAE